MNKEKENNISDFAKEIWKNSIRLYETDKDQPQYVEVNKIFDLVDKYNAISEQENQALKKQLENCYCNRTDCSGRIKDSKQYDSLIQQVEKQQKEFIEYLKEEITRKNHRWEQLANQKNRNEDALLRLDVKIEEDEMILSKYKEIIGV